MKYLKYLCMFIIMACIVLPLCACGRTLSNEISQENWNDNRQYVKLSTGITMSYVEMGNPNGEVLILQHGMTDNSRSWSLAAPYFAQAGYHIYIPDLRGQGKSQETNGYYTTSTYATDLKAFFDAMNINKAILIGHSLGSITVQNFWLMFPERCSKIVLVSSTAMNGYQNTILNGLYNTYIKPLAENEHLDRAFMDNVWYNGTTYRETDYSTETYNTFLDNMKTEAQALSKKSWTNIVMGFMYSNIYEDYKYFDKSIHCYLFHGSTDTMAAGEYQEELRNLLGIPESNYKEYTDVGHNIQYEIPHQFATDTLAWLKG